MGSGTTVEVANKMKRDAIGIEIIPEYYDSVRQQFAPIEYYLMEPEVKYETVESPGCYTVR
jgi:site-specific DNA-methyltransferase (adenine-specific)/site-specific DNA-methyltransferase (cytosine-N4-specific)